MSAKKKMVTEVRDELIRDLAWIALAIGEEGKASKDQIERIQGIKRRLRQLDGKS